MIAILFGPPGVGKGTQAELLSQKYKFLKFSMGDVLREEISLNSPLGNKVEKYLKQGILAPDDIVFEVVEDFLLENQKENILFDGFPRNINQAVSLERTLAQMNLSVSIALELHISQEEIIKRLVNRRYCPRCSKIYNYITDPPKINGLCDICGIDLIKREDDDEGIIKKRLAIYHEQTKPIIEYYKSFSIYKQVDATGSQEEVSQKISQFINAYLK